MKKSHCSSYFSISPILVSLLLAPLLLISLLASSFSWNSFEFVSSFSLGWSDNIVENHSTNFNVSNSNDRLISDSLQQKLRNESPQKSALSSAETRGFVMSGLHRKYSKSEKVEAVLSKARFSIRKAAKKNSLISSNYDDDNNFKPHGPIYRNANAFYRSYLEMEKSFKIYVYKEGEAPIFHNGPCRSIYSTEGRFIHEMERGRHYRTNDPDEAHVYFMPFSVVVMVQYLYESAAQDMTVIGRTLADYVHTISQRHPFWNRSLGADHFMLSCHDWGPYSSSFVPLLFNTSIRVLCNANTSEGFNPLKDIALPEINLKTGEIKGLLGGPPPSQRSNLAFFAGGAHGHIRHLLFDRWKENDPDIRVYEKLPPNVSYEAMLKDSKYCLCPSGYEVASPRVVEAIYSECVPVLISDSYVPPFSDVLDWSKFSVTVAAEDIPNIKNILMGISDNKYLEMQKRVKQVQRHFVINGPPERYDLFHMIIHSIWLRRLNLRLHTSA